VTLAIATLRPEARNRPWTTQSERIKADDFEDKSNGCDDQEENNGKENSGKNPSEGTHRISFTSDYKEI